MLDGFPSMNFIFEGSDEIILGEGFMNAGVDFFHQMFFGYHLAGYFFTCFGVNGEVSLGKTPLP